jgi:predicted Zn-dependent protease
LSKPMSSMVRYRCMRRVYVLAVLLPLAFAPAAKSQDPKKDPDQIGARDVSKGINFYSIEKEMAMGKEMARELERHKTPITDKQITGYVDRIGQNLAQHSDSKIPLTFKVIEGDEPNAITLPGGHIYVQMGLLRLADTEAELAAALAHEVAHVAARHGTRQATQTAATQAATIPLIFLGGWMGGICFRASSLVLPVGQLAIQRGYELEADTLGLQYLYKSGYDPLAMVDIFEKLFSFDERKHGKISRVFSDHPVFGVRLVSVQKNIENILKAQPEYILNTSAFDNVKTHIAMLDWVPKPPPPDDSKRPTLMRKTGEQLIASKKAVPQSDARASQIKEAYTIK